MHTIHVAADIDLIHASAATRLHLDRDAVTVVNAGEATRLPATRVYLMTGFAPNMQLLRYMGVPIDETTGSRPMRRC